VAIFTVCFLFAASAWNKKWKNPNENVKYEHEMWSRMLYRTIDLFACKRPRGSQGLAPGLSLPIILTLLSMIIDNEKAGSKYTHNLDN
jgi:hypothetical protein